MTETLPQAESKVTQLLIAHWMNQNSIVFEVSDQNTRSIQFSRIVRTTGEKLSPVLNNAAADICLQFCRLVLREGLCHACSLLTQGLQTVYTSYKQFYECLVSPEKFTTNTITYLWLQHWFINRNETINRSSLVKKQHSLMFYVARKDGAMVASKYSYRQPWNTYFHMKYIDMPDRSRQ